MQETGVRNQAYGADKFGLKELKAVHWNLTDAPLYERAIAAGEANIVAGGALCAETGHHTGRSPKDKHTVVDDLTRDSVWWDGNRKMTQENFDNLYQDFLRIAKASQLFAQDLYGGADKTYRIKVRVFTELAWHSLFIRTLLIRPERAELAGFVPDMTIIDLPSFKPDAKRHGGREGSDTMVAIDFTRKIVLICGTFYAGEMKKSVFTTLNFYLPAQGVMPMHCSANVGPNGDSALFFGLSGTGKTTLSADPSRTLIGDDETGWGPDGIFNFEGGCYAKMRRSHPRERAADLGRHQPLRRDPGKRGVRSDHPRAGLHRHLEDREYPLGLSARLHPECLAHRLRRPSEEHRLPHRRRLWRDAADRQAHAGAGDVSLPLGLHREGRRHREGPGRRAAGILHLLRRAVPAAPAGRIRQPAARLYRQAQRRLLAGQFRLDRRQVRRRPPHADQGDARAGHRRARRLAEECVVTAPIRISASRCRPRCRASSRTCSIR